MKIIYKTIALLHAIKSKIYRAINPIKHARSIGVHVGVGCRFLNVNFGSEPYLISIGNHVSATTTTFVTHDGGVWIFREKYPDIDVISPIKVGNNVFIGSNVIILPGVTIGDNVVIGAGAIVSKDIPANSVAAGVPAKVIKSVDQYFEKVNNKKIDIKKMSCKKKKEYLLNLFTGKV